jgi:hypothetical protein
VKRSLAVNLAPRPLDRLPSERAMLGDDHIVVKALLDQRVLDHLQRLTDAESTLFKLLFGYVWQAYLTILSRRTEVAPYEAVF